MILVMPWEISSVLKNISVENTVITSNGFVKNALKAMQFNRITKLISKLAELVDILVIVDAFFQGIHTGSMCLEQYSFFCNGFWKEKEY